MYLDMNGCRYPCGTLPATWVDASYVARSIENVQRKGASPDAYTTITRTRVIVPNKHIQVNAGTPQHTRSDSKSSDNHRVSWAWGPKNRDVIWDAQDLTALSGSPRCSTTPPPHQTSLIPYFTPEPHLRNNAESSHLASISYRRVWPLSQKSFAADRVRDACESTSCPPRAAVQAQPERPGGSPSADARARRHPATMPDYLGTPLYGGAMVCDLPAKFADVR